MSTEVARAQARIDYNKGLGHEENPYPKGSVEHLAYMLEMGRLQQEEFNQECLNRVY